MVLFVVGVADGEMWYYLEMDPEPKINTSKENHEYWDEKDTQDLDRAESVTELFTIAKRVLSRMPKPVAQVCGPVSTGGLGSIKANLEALGNTIKNLEKNGVSIFDQTPYDAAMQRIKEKISPTVYFQGVLTDFNLPIFEDGGIQRIYFMPDWQSSMGATWEHAQAQRLGIEIVYL